MLAAGEVPAVSEVVFLIDFDLSHFPAVAPVRAAAPDPEFPEE